jgi:hypothetical protein
LLTLSPTNIVAKATPNILSPPDGRFVKVTVTGSFQESATNASPTGFFYVTDQYGDVAPRAEIPLQRSATNPSTLDFSFTLDLQAKRGSMTYNGRQYDILVGARDAAGAVGKTIAVNVPKEAVVHHAHPAAHHEHATAHHKG